MEGTRTATATTSADRRIGNDLSSPPFYRQHLLPGLKKMRKNTSNTRAVYFGRRLLALWSGGLPYKLDALALSTEGRSQLGGAVKRDDQSLDAKAAIDSRRNRILFYCVMWTRSRVRAYSICTNSIRSSNL
jgi:carotenoid cleavage dioxygenase-like enzyme